MTLGSLSHSTFGRSPSFESIEQLSAFCTSIENRIEELTEQKEQYEIKVLSNALKEQDNSYTAGEREAFRKAAEAAHHYLQDIAEQRYDLENDLEYYKAMLSRKVNENNGIQPVETSNLTPAPRLELVK